MYPPEVGFMPRTRSWPPGGEYARDALQQLHVQGVVGDDVELQVVSGNGWDQAPDDAEWIDGRGSGTGNLTASRDSSGVLGSRGTKIMPGPVPVLVLPGMTQTSSVPHNPAVGVDLRSGQHTRTVAGQPDHDLETSSTDMKAIRCAPSSLPTG